MNQYLSEPFQRECSDMVAHKDTAVRETARNRSSSYLDAPSIQHPGSEQRTTVNSNPRLCSSSMFIPGSTSTTLLVAAYELEDQSLSQDQPRSLWEVTAARISPSVHVNILRPVCEYIEMVVILISIFLG
jgi:hypothetical protein